MSPGAGRWFEVRRPARLVEVLRLHLPWAALTGAVLAAARFFPFREHKVVACMFRRVTELPCPSCGYTRAFCDLAHGNVAGAWSETPAAALVFAVAVLVFLWNTAALASGRLILRGSWLRPGPRTAAVLWILTAAIYGANWIYRLATGRV